ncbi:MAG: pirin family protein [Caldiserica bacterium]|nr:MAG: pirin family protein [Caldisericota bacterium]
MSSLKKVTHLLPAIEIDMGGFLVKQPMPTQKMNRVDPFLLLHHARTKFYNDRPARTQGIGPHPHRGFSPVTFVIEGEIHHRDSRGNNQIAKEGEVQWMHAGMGIIHSERPSEALAERNGIQEIIQLWINSPADRKMKEPYYKYLSKEEIPVITSEDRKIKNKLIAGEFEGKKSAIPTESELLILWGVAKKDGEQTIQIPNDFNTMLYLIKGNMRIKGYGIIDAENLLVFEEEGSSIEMSFSENSQFLVLSGNPINEKVSQSGPFVMNSQTEILEAMRDYQMGKMGVLIEEE